MLKHKYLNHCSSEETKWITSINGEEFEKKYKIEKGRSNLDVYEDTKCGLYSKEFPWINAIDNHWMSNIDLEQVNLNLMKATEHGSTSRPLQ